MSKANTLHIFEACERDDLDSLICILKEKPGHIVRVSPYSGNNVLHVVSAADALQCARYILNDAGIRKRVNATNRTNMTPLSYARSVGMARLLLQHGALVTADVLDAHYKRLFSGRHHQLDPLLETVRFLLAQTPDLGQLSRLFELHMRTWEKYYIDTCQRLLAILFERDADQVLSAVESLNKGLGIANFIRDRYRMYKLSPLLVRPPTLLDEAQLWKIVVRFAI